MRVELKAEGNTNLKVVLDIIFRKTNPGERRQQNRKELIDTACMIFREGREIACAIARQNPLDDYNKIVGKKVALAKAIASIGFLKPVNHCLNVLTINHGRKIRRRHIWNVFFETFERWN